MLFLFFCFNISKNNSESLKIKQNEKTNLEIIKLKDEISMLNKKINECEIQIKVTMNYNNKNMLSVTDGLDPILKSKKKYIKERDVAQKKLNKIKASL